MTEAHQQPGNTSFSGWRRQFPDAVSAAAHKRDRVCVQCGSDQRLEVDHTIGIADGIAAGMDRAQLDSLDNAQLLCHACHQVKTSGELQRGHRRWRDRGKRPERPHPGLL